MLAVSESRPAMPQDAAPNAAPPDAEVELAYRGLHGYIGSHAGASPETHRYGAGFYASVWSLIDRPIRNFQIGLPSTWLTPDNSDNRTEPLCPPGTIARDNWPERGPTYGSVFQTMEGGLGYWAGNRFHYGPPKFSHERDAQLLQHRGRVAGLAVLPQQRAVARRHARHRPGQQPPV